MTTISACYDAIIIGSGHNGLTAAACLAAAGQQVLVLERQAEFGGATKSQRVFPDHDAWLSRYSYLVSLFPAKLQQLLRLNFRTLQRSTASFTPWTDQSGRHRGLVISNSDPERSKVSLEELGGAAAVRGWEEFAALQSAFAEFVWPTLTQPLQSRNTFEKQLNSDLQRRAWRSFVEQPLGKIIEQIFQHDVLRGLVMTDGKIGVFTEPHDPSLLQNRCFVYHVIGNGCGEWRVPEGGMRSLVNALLQRCHALNVTLLADAPALNVEPGPELQTVTFSDPHDGSQRHVLAKNVLVNAGPRTLARLLGKSWQPMAGDEGSVVKINLLLERLPRIRAAGVSSNDAFGGTFHIDEGYEQMRHSWTQASAGKVPETPPGEVYCHTLTDRSILSPALESAGWHTLTLFGLDMPYRLFSDPAQQSVRKEEIKKLYFAGLNRICEEPVESCLAHAADGSPCVEVKTPLDLERELDLDLGNIFHNQLSWFFGNDQAAGSGEAGTMSGEWGVETEYPHIFRCGSSAQRGGAVSGIPGYNAACCVLGPGILPAV